jgi:hypothetical protein
MAPNAEPVEIEVMVHLVRAKAYLVSVDGDVNAGQWIPRSEILDEDRDKSGIPVRGRAPDAYPAILTIPAWLAREKGLDTTERVPGIDDLFNAPFHPSPRRD